jgi:AcrR family transcriptional regulator
MPAERAVRPRLRKDAELNRLRILAAAREVFRERGVAATLNDVAHHAGLGVGTVYRRFSDKEELVDALFADIVSTVESYTREALEYEDAWTGFVTALERVCEIQALDRGLREVMLGTGRGPQRQAQIGARIAPLVDQLVEKAQRQGTLRQDLRPADLPVLQLMVAAVTDHTGQPDLWRRYLTLVIDGMRARPAGQNTPLPDARGSQHQVQQALVDSSVRAAGNRSAGDRAAADRGTGDRGAGDRSTATRSRPERSAPAKRTERTDSAAPNRLPPEG